MAATNKNNLGIIYLAGCGRSGQTLLESILHSQGGIEVLGAITNLPEKLNTTCSCGQPLARCSFWSKVWNDFLKNSTISLEEFYKLQRRVEAVGPYKGSFLSSIHKKDLQEQYVRNTRLFYETIWKQVPKSTRYLGDASKTTYVAAKKPLELYKIFGDNLKVIHLIRDVRGVMWSYSFKGVYLNRSDTDAVTNSLLAPIRALVGWKFANHYASLFQNISPKNYLRLRYEDLVAFPTETLMKIGAFLDMNFSNLVERIDAGLDQQDKHSVMGNPMRFQKQVRLKPDLTWQRQLPKSYRTFCRMFAGRQLAAYGYNIY